MKKTITITLFFLLFLFCPSISLAQHSVARQWNEVLLNAIRNDLARPTVHARNLFHISAAMYDAWAVYDGTSLPYFLGNDQGGYNIPFEGIPTSTNIAEDRNEAISYAAYTLLTHRFSRSPGWGVVSTGMDNLMNSLGYDVTVTDTDYATGSAAALGNYIAESINDFGLQDGANEIQNYVNQEYVPVNDPMNLQGNFSLSTVNDPNRWQPLKFEAFVDQSGNEIPGGTPTFLGAEWGNVIPFSLTSSDMSTYNRDGMTFKIYNDPDAPCFLESDGTGSSSDYKWNFELVSLWSSHLDPYDGVQWDISPGAIGNIDMSAYPSDYTDFDQFYDTENGGEKDGIASGYTMNPITGAPYEPQIVPRGDYTRVLAEFWADGPDSETPPGHWFTILNYVTDHPLHEPKFMGQGETLDALEWDVKTYFILGGTMHDAAISAWSIKGYYDYIRPISAIRYMATKGQSSDSGLPSYDLEGIMLKDGFIELIEAGDALAGSSNENVGKIKLLAWRGHDFISDAETDEAGVGWILAEEWWPYQRPSFVTPPFAGYVSGHSTFSRAAAKVLTLLTGDEYFPGGMGEFLAPQNDFLVFEKGPSVDVALQWATYYDASDQCSLSRIWGGIHPPMDDIWGRLIGDEIGAQAFGYAHQYTQGTSLGVEDELLTDSVKVYPNPSDSYLRVSVSAQENLQSVHVIDMGGRQMKLQDLSWNQDGLTLDVSTWANGLYILSIGEKEQRSYHKIIVKHK